MNFANYSEFREAVRNLLEGDEIGNTFSVDALDLMIALGEQRVYRELKASTLYTSSTLTTVANNALALPSAVIALDKVVIGDRQVEVIDLWRLDALNESNSTANNVIFCAQRGENLEFFPEVADSTSITLYYYARPADIATAMNSTIARYPEVFLYAAIAEASPYLGEDNRAPMWEAKFANAISEANADNRWRAYSGSPLRVRNR